MTNRVKFPILAKLLLLVSGSLLTATGAYLALAVSLLREDKTTLVFELNESTVKTLAAEAESSFGKIADKMKLLTQGHRDEAWSRAVFEAEPDLVSYTLYTPPTEANADASQWKPIASVRNFEYLKLYGLKSEDAEHLREQVPIPFAKVVAKRTWVTNATLPGGAPIVTIALAIETHEGDAVSERIAVADVRLDRILKLLSGRGIATAYLVDADGKIIAHPDAALVSSRASLGDVPIVREAIDSQVVTQLKAFDWKGASWLGAYSTVSFGNMHVISQVPAAEVSRASRKLVEKSMLFALIIITSSLLLSTWLARGSSDLTF